MEDETQKQKQNLVKLKLFFPSLIFLFMFGTSLFTFIKTETFPQWIIAIYSLFVFSGIFYSTILYYIVVICVLILIFVLLPISLFTIITGEYTNILQYLSPFFPNPKVKDSNSNSSKLTNIFYNSLIYALIAYTTYTAYLTLLYKQIYDVEESRVRNEYLFQTILLQISAGVLIFLYLLRLYKTFKFSGSFFSLLFFAISVYTTFLILGIYRPDMISTYILIALLVATSFVGLFYITNNLTKISSSVRSAIPANARDNWLTYLIHTLIFVIIVGFLSFVVLT